MYLKKGDSFTNINPEYNQVFKNPFILNIGKHQIIKLRTEDRVNDLDLAIIEFLFCNTFATLDQLVRFAETRKISEDEVVKSSGILFRLEKLVEHRILNKFIMSRTMEKLRDEDMLIIYCMDIGGRILLANYSNLDTTNWYTSVNMRSGNSVSKVLISTELNLRFMENSPKRLQYFKKDPHLRIEKTNVVPSFEFCIGDDIVRKYYIGEIVTEDDFPFHFKEKVFTINDIINSKAWKKYYYDTKVPPSVIFVADSDALALDLSKLVSGITDIKEFRVTTLERMAKPLHSSGAFLKYMKESDVLKEVRIASFAP